MSKYRIIGNMTGNSMDAIDLVVTEFDGDKMTDICTYSKPYSKEMQSKMAFLRKQVFNKLKPEILALPDFQKIHDEYVKGIAECINDMCQKNHLDKKQIDAIGFHGKTLDYNPPSKAKKEKTLPYTLQIGSGKMLADLTGIKVIYDFRSALIMNGFEGAPLVPPHNAHIAATEGNACYYNGGNTSNFAWIIDGKALIGADAGPFNEYIDSYIRKYSPDTYDKDGQYGLKGKLLPELLQRLFNVGREYYERPLPKSGDPQYYHTAEIFDGIEKRYGFADYQTELFCDIVHTLEYFAAYVAVYSLTLCDTSVSLPAQIILFGGGWKNPVVYKAFCDLIAGKGYLLPEHQQPFHEFLSRFHQPLEVKYSRFGEYMEARLFADMARYQLEQRVWEIPEIIASGKKIICGSLAKPEEGRAFYDDMICQAAKGWQSF